MASINLNDGGVAVYATFSLFPTSTYIGALAVDASTDKLYEFDGSTWILIGPGTGGGGTGTVTSVGLSADPIFSVSGSPVTTAGTLSFALNSESANSVLAGPTSGSGVPTFRSLVAGDIPSISESQVINLVSDLATINSQILALQSSTYYVNEFTLAGSDVSNGYVTLTKAPVHPTLTVMSVIGGPVQTYGVDYSISGTTLTWSGTFLDGTLVAGDILVVQLS